MQLEIGKSVSLFHIDYSGYAFLCTDSYIKSVWKYIDEKNIPLFADIDIPQPCRTKDVSLTEEVIAHRSKFTEQELLMFNRCHKYLQVYYLSDIVTGNGKQITELAFECKKDP